MKNLPPSHQLLEEALAKPDSLAQSEEVGRLLRKCREELRQMDPSLPPLPSAPKGFPDLPPCLLGPSTTPPRP